MESQPVFDQRPRPHRDRIGGHHAEVKPRRRDRLEVVRVGEEVEDLLRRGRQQLLALQGSHRHVAAA
jgi:hypothetical protein